MVNATELHMPLSCNKHTWHGKPAQLPCRKCAWELEKNATLDSVFSVRHVVNRHPGGPWSTPLTPSRPPVVTSNARDRGPRVEGVGSEVSAESRSGRPAKRVEKCAGCQDSASVTVWGRRLCRWCGARVNDVALTGACVGIGYWVAASAFVQWLREIPSHLRPYRGAR